jgi:hypothetical protein
MGLTGLSGQGVATWIGKMQGDRKKERPPPDGGSQGLV